MDDDEVVEECDVLLAPNYKNLHIFQYPLRTPASTYTFGDLEFIKVKKKSKRFQLLFRVDRSFERFDSSNEMSSKYTSFVLQNGSPMDGDYFVLLKVREKVILFPVQAIDEFRPWLFHHLRRHEESTAETEESRPDFGIVKLSERRFFQRSKQHQEQQVLEEREPFVNYQIEIYPETGQLVEAGDLFYEDNTKNIEFFNPYVSRVLPARKTEK